MDYLIEHLKIRRDKCIKMFKMHPIKTNFTILETLRRLHNLWSIIMISLMDTGSTLILLPKFWKACLWYIIRVWIYGRIVFQQLSLCFLYSHLYLWWTWRMTWVPSSNINDKYSKTFSIIIKDWKIWRSLRNSKDIVSRLLNKWAQ